MHGIPAATVTFALVLLPLCPAASAWTVAREAPPIEAPIAAWTWDLVPRLGGPGLDTAQEAAACALGDINTDKAHDLLIRLHPGPDTPARIVALAGPDFQNALWELPSKADRALQCAPDLNRDGLGDPVMVVTAAAAGGQSMGGRSVDRAMQVLDGATGEILIKRQHKDMNQGTSAGGRVSASSNMTANLLPAVAGAEAFLKTDVQQSVLSGLPAQLPVGQLTTTARSAAELSLLNAQGTVEGVIRIDEPGIEPLAMAPIPVGQGLPDVSVLTAKAVSPVQEATQRVPTLSRFNPDGTLAWARDLEGTQALPLLLPRGGDLDLDGVQDMIVSNVPVGVAAGASSKFQVLSGIDGKTLLDSGSAVTGLATALPLGRLPGGATGILSVAQAQGAATMTLRALDVAGAASWTAEIGAGSFPINVRPDAYTGDPLGFTDLTGDGLPDIGVAKRTAEGLVVQAVDGANGTIAWTTTLADVDRVLPISPRTTLDRVRSTAANIPSDLVAVANTSKGMGLSLVDGVTGQVIWSLNGSLPSGIADASVDVMAAGDLNADGVQDLLATVSSMARVPMAAAADDSSSSTGGSGEAVYAVSGSDGSTIWTNSTAGSEPPPALSTERGEAFEERAPETQEGDGKGRAPGPAALAALVCVAIVAAWRRTRRA